MTKEFVDTAMKEMPQEFNLDELVERLEFMEKVNQGLKDIEEGRTISQNEMREKMVGWRR